MNQRERCINCTKKKNMNSDMGAAQFDNLRIDQSSIARTEEETCEEGIFDVQLEVT